MNLLCDPANFFPGLIDAILQIAGYGLAALLASIYLYGVYAIVRDFMERRNDEEK